MSIYDRIKTPLPKNLHPAVQRAIKGQEIEIPGDKLPLARLEVWDEAVDETQDIADFRRDDGRLEENADRWAFNEPGRIHNGRRDSYLEGEMGDGEYLSFNSNFVRYSRLGPGTIDRITQNTYGDGRIIHSHLNLNDPSQSFQTFINSDGENVEPPTEQQNRNSVPSGLSSNSPGVLSLAEALKATKGPAKEIFLNQTQSLANYRLKQQDQLKSLIGELPQDQKDAFAEILKAGRSSMPMELFHQALETPDAKEIKKLAGEWAAVESVPETSADGLTQRMVSYVSPQGLQMQTAQRQWDFDKKTGLPIADSVIIGAGPGGLASGYHLANTGAHTLIFEAKSAGQGFSDDTARSVKSLRTSVESTDLLGSNWRGFEGHEASLRNQYPSIIANVEDCQSQWEEATGENLRESGEREHSGPFDTAFPRAGLYDHMQRLASGLTTHYPDTFLIERSPVKDIKPAHDGLFEVTTHTGHRVLTRTLVPSTGFVGADGELARQLPAINALVEASEDKILAIHDDNTEMAKAADIAQNLESLESDGTLKQAVITSDRKLGSPDVRALVSKLPKGSRVGFVGGGESGVKGILEVAKLNPDAVIEFYVSGSLEPYQTQVPVGHLGFANVNAIREHEDLKSKTFDLLKSTKFGTPITALSLGKLFKLVGEGRVKLHNLGTFFDEKSMVAEASEGSITLSHKSAEVRESVVAERQKLANSGLLKNEDVHDLAPSKLSMLFTSVGYDTKAAKTPGYMKGLVEEGLFDPAKGSLDSRIMTNSAGFATDTADTALVGRAMQGWSTPEALSSHLPKREVPSDRLRDDLIQQGIKVSRTPKPQTLQKDEVEDVLNSGARSVAQLDNLEEIETEREFDQLAAFDDAALAAQDPLRILNQMDRVLPEYLSPTEKELVRRGQELTHRITDFQPTR